MRACPACGESVSPGATSCGVCGSALPHRWRLGVYFGSAVVLVAIIAAAALLHSYLQARVIRPPTDFLPAVTRAVVVLDVRPTAPAALLVGSTWSPTDVDALADRAVQLAQTMVDWTGLQLDVKKDASRWFGGELLAASIGGVGSHASGPRSMVLITRVTDLHRARRDLDRAVADLAHEGGWRRTVLRSDARAVTVWGEPGRQSAIAYAAADGCLLVSPNDKAVEACLKSAADPSDRLTETPEFKETRTPLPGNALLWCYLGASDLLDATTELLPELWHGWPEVLRAYLGRSPTTPRPGPRPTARAAGTLAFAATPEKDGIRLHLNYRRSAAEQSMPASPAADDLLKFIPRETAAYAIVRDLQRITLPAPRHQRYRPDAARPFHLWGPLSLLLLPPRDLSGSVLVAVMPRHNGKRAPALAGALADGGAAETGQWLSKLLPHAQKAETEGVTILASDKDTLEAIQAAARTPAKRLQVKAEPGVRVEAWVCPAELSPAFERIGEIGLKVRDDPAGAQGELYVKAEPRYLLGGR